MTLEINEKQLDTTGNFQAGNVKVMFTPTINEDYWMFRVHLRHGQAILGFPKFCTIGIGFAIEEDWNANLPYESGKFEILDHIKQNRKYKDITDGEILVAIEMIQNAAEKYKNNWYGS